MIVHVALRSFGMPVAAHGQLGAQCCGDALTMPTKVYRIGGMLQARILMYSHAGPTRSGMQPVSAISLGPCAYRNSLHACAGVTEAPSGRAALQRVGSCEAAQYKLCIDLHG